MSEDRNVIVPECGDAMSNRGRRTMAMSLLGVLDGYNAFDKGAAEKFVLDPHGIVRSHQATAELVGVQS